jgi:hypothetical protein
VPHNGAQQLTIGPCLTNSLKRTGSVASCRPGRLARSVRRHGEHPLTTERRGYVRYICVCEQCQSPSDHTR